MFFRTLTQKTNAAKSNQSKKKEKKLGKKGHDIHGNHTKREDFILFYFISLERVLSFCLIDWIFESFGDDQTIYLNNSFYTPRLK